jgi:shikimate dehydrogenase
MSRAVAMTRLAVFGNPVKHSLSPRIHRLFADQAGIPVEYTGVEVSEDFLSREVQKLADAGGAGCNITLPLKHQAYELANRASERAEIARSANTLVFNTATRWSAQNTDGPGLLRDLTHNLAIETRDRRICVIGAGGAAAGILYDLLQHQPASLTLFNRTFERATKLAERFAHLGQVTAADLDSMSASEAFDLVINAISAGQFREAPVLTSALFGTDSVCYDLCYGQAHSALNDWCGERGIRCHSGLGMLVEQAAESFYLWTGFRPDTAPVLAELQRELK